MKKFILILILPLLFACSKDEVQADPEIQFFIKTRDTCLTSLETIYTRNEVDEVTFNKVVEENDKKYSCDPITFKDINNNPITGIYGGWLKTGG